MSSASRVPRSPLLKAIRARDLSRVQKALYWRPDVEQDNCLQVACRLADPSIAEALLDAGADPNRISTSYPAMALACACGDDRHPEVRLALVRLLLERGADPNLFPEGQDGALHYAIMYRLTEVVRTLLDAGADVNRPGAYGRTPVAYAAMSGVPETLATLLEAGADIHLANDGCTTPFFELIATSSPSVACAHLLLQAGANVNELDSYGTTPLAAAAAAGHLELLELFLERGADVNALSGHWKESALVRALQNRKFAAAELLLDRGADPTDKDLLKTAIEVGAETVLRRVLRHEGAADPSALAKAIGRGRIELVRELLDSGLSVDAKSGDKTPLMRAAELGNLEILRLLIERGADLEARDASGNTALLHAASQGHVETIELLRAAGADLRAKNDLNWNGLMQATANGRLGAVEYFLAQELPLDEVDREFGYTALTIARVRSEGRIEALLLEHGARERPLHRPPKGRLLPRSECDVCKWLPDRWVLEKTESPRYVPYLTEIGVVRERKDRYTTVTTRLLRCPICATCYEHGHTIDTEDAFVSGPSIWQELKRLTEAEAKAWRKQHKKA